MVELWVIALVVVGTILGALGSVFLKIGSRKLSNIKTIIFNKPLLIGLFLFVFSTVFIIIALKFGNLSKIFPLTSLTYIWVALLSSKIIKENIKSSKIAAFVLIVIGIIFVSS